MKKYFLPFVLTGFLVGCIDQHKDPDFVLARFVEASANIQKASYQIHRIDSFGLGSAVWSRKGTALIERVENDTLFRFHFTGECFDLEKGGIYDGTNEFWIDKKNKSYKQNKAGIGFLGSAGGMMAIQDLLFPDTVYNAFHVEEEDDSYYIKYDFADNEDLQLTDNYKRIKINKETYLPSEIVRSYRRIGSKSVHTMRFSDFRVNENVRNTISDQKANLVDYRLEETSGPRERKVLINQPFISFELENLNDNSNYLLEKGKPVLLDFWEVWCVPCVKSLAEVEKLKAEFNGKINIIGIVSEYPEKAKKFVADRKLTFTNLIGNENIKEAYDVDGFPRYFLIDSEGIIRKKYFGFSAQIEKDIRDVIQ